VVSFKRKWLIIGLVAVVVVGGLAVASKMGGSKAEPKAKLDSATEPVVVTVEPVTARPVRRTVSAVGSLWGWEEVPITPKVEGRVVRVHKFVGDVVQPGDVLLEIDPTDFQLAVREAERGLELELSRLNLTIPPTKEFNFTELPSIARAQALEKQARSRANRLKSSPRTTVTEEEIQQAMTDVDVAVSNVRQAELEARATLASVRFREAALKSAQQRLADTKILVPPPNSSPDPGVPPAKEYVIAFRKVSAGETVRIIPLTDAPPLFRLVIEQPLKLQLTLAERQLAEVRVGQTVELDMEAYPKDRFTGTISRINRTIERSSRTFSVEVVVPNEDRRLSAGSFVKATIVTKVEDKAHTVPEESLVQFAGVTKVFVLEGGIVREVVVKTGIALIVTEGSRNRTWLEVEGDLPAGAQVVTSGQTRLANGVNAKIR